MPRPIINPPHRWILPLLALLLGSQPARAQAEDAGTSVPPVGVVVVQMALEPHLVMSLGYLRAVGPRRERLDLGVGASLKVSPYLLGRGAGRLSLVTAGRWVANSGWGVAAASEAYLARGRNRSGTIHGIGLELRSAPGYYGERWGVAADLGWQATLVSHVRHSAEAREAFEDRYADGTSGGDGPVDGWYGSTAHRARLGLEATRSLADGASLRVAAGSRFSLQRQGILLGFAHGQVPVYLEASVGFGH